MDLDFNNSNDLEGVEEHSEARGRRRRKKRRLKKPSGKRIKKVAKRRRKRASKVLDKATSIANKRRKKGRKIVRKIAPKRVNKLLDKAEKKYSKLSNKQLMAIYNRTKNPEKKRLLSMVIEKQAGTIPKKTVVKSVAKPKTSVAPRLKKGGTRAYGNPFHTRKYKMWRSKFEAKSLDELKRIAPKYKSSPRYVKDALSDAYEIKKNQVSKSRNGSTTTSVDPRILRSKPKVESDIMPEQLDDVAAAEVIDPIVEEESDIDQPEAMEADVAEGVEDDIAEGGGEGIDEADDFDIPSEDKMVKAPETKKKKSIRKKVAVFGVFGKALLGLIK